MLKSDVIAYYGSIPAAAKAIGLTRAAPHFWGKYVPPRAAAKYHDATKGRLKFDPRVYAEDRDKAG